MQNITENRCIFCLRTDGGFEKEAHVIPESACNEDLLLPNGIECDRCNVEFSPIEQKVIRSFPGQFFRVAMVKETKRGKKPTADIKGGKIKRMDSFGRPTIQVLQYSRNPCTAYPNIEPEKSELIWNGQKLSGQHVSAFLAKICLGYFCLQGEEIYGTGYDHLRECVRSVGSSPFIPFFVGVHSGPTQSIQLLGTEGEIIREVRSVWVTFPGFSGILPTVKNPSQDAVYRLESFLQRNMTAQFLLVTDPTWCKPIRVKLTLEPKTEAGRLQHRKIWDSLNTDRVKPCR
jgi:hypothetical protein